MTTQEPPRCPYCDVPMHIEYAQKDASLWFDWKVSCENDKCGLVQFGCNSKEKAHTQASSLKLLDRKVEEAVKAEQEACAKVAWNHLCDGYHEDCDCNGAIDQAIRARSNPEPEKGK